MAFDEELAERVREELVAHGVAADTEERKMFGGLAFMLRGNMCCGIVGDELMVRVGPDAYDDALRRPHTREMDFTGKPMRGLVYVSTEGLNGSGLGAWVGRGVAFAESLSAK